MKDMTPARNMSLGGRTRIITVELAKLGEVAKKLVRDTADIKR